MVWTTEEATRFIDEIVGRCVRDPEYANRVLLDPEGTLAENDPSEDILNDFRALARDREQVLDHWKQLRRIVYE